MPYRRHQPLDGRGLRGGWRVRKGLANGIFREGIDIDLFVQSLSEPPVDETFHHGAAYAEVLSEVGEAGASSDGLDVFVELALAAGTTKDPVALLKAFQAARQLEDLADPQRRRGDGQVVSHFDVAAPGERAGGLHPCPGPQSFPHRSQLRRPCVLVQIGEQAAFGCRFEGACGVGNPNQRFGGFGREGGGQRRAKRQPEGSDIVA